MENLNDFKAYLAANFAGEKNNVKNLMKIAGHISLSALEMRKDYGMMRDYYKLVFTLNENDFLGKFLMQDYLKDFFNKFADYYGIEYIDAMMAQFKKAA